MLMSPAGFPTAMGSWSAANWTPAKATGILDWFYGPHALVGSWPNEIVGGPISPVQATGANQPSLSVGINGLQCPFFPVAALGSSAVYDCGAVSPTSGNSYWVCVVAKATSGLGSNATIYGRWWNNNAFSIGNNATTGAGKCAFFVGNDTASCTATTNAAPGTSAFCAMGVWNNSNSPGSPTAVIYLISGGSAVLQTSKSTAGSDYAGSFPNLGTGDHTSIGAGLSGAGGPPTGDVFNGYIGEIFDGTGAPPLAQAPAYILKKWNI